VVTFTLEYAGNGEFPRFGHSRNSRKLGHSILTSKAKVVNRTSGKRRNYLGRTPELSRGMGS